MERRQLLKSLIAAPLASVGLSSYGSLANVLVEKSTNNKNKLLFNAKHNFNQALEANQHLIGFSNIE